MNVLETGKKDGVENIGFRVYDGKVYTYRQDRRGLTQPYWKSILKQDGISTEPHAMT